MRWIYRRALSKVIGADKTVLANILAQVDFLIQNLGPGVVERPVFGAETMLERHPALIVRSISGCGSSGSRAKQMA